ncbi:MAG: hypothetical protein NTV34_13715 [Proteobacteria bacterium]|nr:hypothetical protein [Pseudomonadota bacterium]
MKIIFSKRIFSRAMKCVFVSMAVCQLGCNGISVELAPAKPRAAKGDDSASAPAQTPQGAIPPSDLPPVKIVERNIEITSSGGLFQLKSANLLRSSIKSCMGPDMTKISADMILLQDLPLSPPAPDGRIRFLLPVYISGSDIIDMEKSSLVDPDRGARSAVAADGLTDTYLRSLALIGDVVAHNCSSNNPLCACETEALAIEMVSRCVPTLDPKSAALKEAAQILTSVCSQGGSGMRRAVSSLLSSYAFGLAR